MEEAIDGWITTNILLEKFKHRHDKNKPPNQIISPENFDADMVGVLDLGGASTQVTFTCKFYSIGFFSTNILLFKILMDKLMNQYQVNLQQI